MRTWIDGIGLSWMLAVVLGVGAAVGCVTVDDKGEGDDDSEEDGSPSSGAGASGSGSTSGPSGSYVCCLNSSKYECPDKAAFDQCVGFDMDACMSACGFDDFDCQDACFEQLASASHDPSGCTPNDSLDCGGSGAGGSSGEGPGPSSSSGGPECSGELSGCDYDSDCCSNNCTNNACQSNGFGSPCDYDSDCDSNNCYDGTCQ